MKFNASLKAVGSVPTSNVGEAVQAGDACQSFPQTASLPSEGIPSSRTWPDLFLSTPFPVCIAGLSVSRSVIACRTVHHLQHFLAFVFPQPSLSWLLEPAVLVAVRDHRFIRPFLVCGCSSSPRLGPPDMRSDSCLVRGDEHILPQLRTLISEVLLSFAMRFIRPVFCTWVPQGALCPCFSLLELPECAPSFCLSLR